MTGALLLVTWFLAGGQPATSYSVQFSTLQACNAARAELVKEEQRLGVVAYGGPTFGPRLSAVCVVR